MEGGSSSSGTPIKTSTESGIKRVSLATIHYPKAFNPAGNEESEFLVPKRWVRLLFEPDTNIETIKDAVSTGDITGDGDTKLVLVDFSATQCRLKLLKGLNFITDAHLPDEPAGCVTFYSEDSQMPCIAVAIGNSLLIYRNMKPYYRCNVDPVDLHPSEVALWTSAMEKQISAQALVDGLDNLRKEVSITKMAWKSQYFLSLKDLEAQEEALNHLIANSVSKLNLTNVLITCLTTIKRNLNSDRSPDIIVIGTELGAIYCIDSSAFNVLLHTSIIGTPDRILCTGEYDAEWRFFVSLREGDITVLRKKLNDNVVFRSSLNIRNYVMSLCLTQTEVVIACRDNKLIFCSLKGKKLSETTVSEPIIDLEAFYYRPRNYSGALVVFRHRIDLYMDGQVTDSLKFDSAIKWIKFGKMGREDAVLIVGHMDTGIGLHVFRRTAVLEPSKNAGGPPAAQTHRLNVPKKTKLYVEQCIRERENTSKIFTTYQRDLFMLRLQITRSFADMININAGMLPTKDAEKLDVNLELNGFGPHFRINIAITPSTEMPDHRRWITFSYDKNEYKMAHDLIPLCRIVPKATMTYTNAVECLHPENAAQGEVKVYILSENRKAPLWMTKFEMPVSEQSFT